MINFCEPIELNDLPELIRKNILHGENSCYVSIESFDLSHDFPFGNMKGTITFEIIPSFSEVASPEYYNKIEKIAKEKERKPFLRTQNILQ